MIHSHTHTLSKLCVALFVSCIQVLVKCLSLAFSLSMLLKCFSRRCVCLYERNFECSFTHGKCEVLIKKTPLASTFVSAFNNSQMMKTENICTSEVLSSVCKCKIMFS